ncbi:hypothetical protein MGN01_19150 [Methylobacterium gnaphalii]|uniref:Uncharacterized protein n=1 Tax=Methylobacterium gnaphalii TaxID=1010610 RepID=A0A512JJE5_9HYPH|nr:hypothetical protein MGN01_19150 [Methylobacterium gnaphalii]
MPFKLGFFMAGRCRDHALKLPAASCGGQVTERSLRLTGSPCTMLAHQADEALEQVVAVAWAWGGFGMVLN